MWGHIPPVTPNMKQSIPFHEREYVYTRKEAVIVSGMSARTFHKYFKMDSFSIPTSKAFITNWVRRTGFPHQPMCCPDPMPLALEAQRMRREGVDRYEIANLLQRSVRTIHRYFNRSEDATSSNSKVS